MDTTALKLQIKEQFRLLVALSMGKTKIDEVTKQRTIHELTEARDAIERLITTARAA